MTSDQLVRLRCETTNNEWGKRGLQSIARKIALATTVEASVATNLQPYAELWMGTHPWCPSRDFATNRPLRDIVKENPLLLTESISKRFDNHLPFLFKIISIEKALCIQAHPKKELAQQLHARDAVTYPDANQKPEMVIALAHFEALYGFRPITEISELLSCIPPFQDLIGSRATHKLHLAKKWAETGEEDPELTREAIKQAFKAALDANTEKVAISARDLVRIANECVVSGTGTSGIRSLKLAQAITQLAVQYPDDIGLFIMLFMNHVELEAGEAMFVQSGALHAYLSGDIIECMAPSANILRAGFTPKFRDLDTLVEALEYAPQPPIRIFPVPENGVQIYHPLQQESSSSYVLYNPPVEEFAVTRIILGQEGGQAVFDMLYGPSIFICMEGSGTLSVYEKIEKVEFGFIFFVGHGVKAVLESRSSKPFICYRAFCDAVGS